LTDRIASWVAPRHAEGLRLDQYLVRLIPDQSRSQIQRWIRAGRARVNGKQVKTGYLVQPGDEVDLCAPEPEQAIPFPEEIPLDVVYEDQDLAVINKPAGMVCHIGAGIRHGTLVNALLHRYGSLESEDAARPGIVHRLDKLTSGLLVVARNKWTHRGLAQQFKSREVKKEYLALVHGRPRHPSGTVDLPLGRDPRDRKRISVHARRKRAAVTHFRVEQVFGALSLLRICIETGRTHQIRVHLAHVGHPIVGDTLYGGKRDRDLPKLAAAAGLDRVFLHAHRLEFRHPRTGEAVSFTAPLPPELTEFLALLE
jgi:23S rRNA pseudouridine1911/1915/1917 synthase